MSSPDIAILNQNLTFYLNVKDATGAPVDSDALPTYSIYEDSGGAAGTPMSGYDTVSMTKLDDSGTAGYYSAQISVTAGNGFERYESYSIRYEAAVSTVSISAADSFMVLGGSDTFSSTTGALTTLANVQEYGGLTVGVDETLLTALINRATDAMEGFCDRTFTSTTYRQLYDGFGVEELLTDEYPIISIQMLAVGRADCETIKNTSTDAYNAFISISDTEMELTVSGGDNDGSETLVLSDYATLTALNTAIGVLAKGWDTSVLNSIYAIWSPTELLPITGMAALENTAVAQANLVYLKLPETPKSNFIFEADPGIITINGRFPNGTQNVILRYTAGFATTPADLEQICIELTLVYYYGRKRDRAMEQEKIGDYMYKVQSGVGGIPPELQDRLSRFRKRQL